MLDEAHERTLYLDIVVGLLYKIQRKRKDLRLIISSATLDADSFKTFFNTKESSSNPSKKAAAVAAAAAIFNAKAGAGQHLAAPASGAAVMQIEGRTYPVEIFYSAKPVADYVAATVQTILDIHNEESSGDILAFLTGQDEVDQVCEQLRERSAQQQQQHGKKKSVELMPVPLYGGLPAQDQMKAFDVAPDGARKAIIATNIAEASVTIDGVVYVVDCGFVKAKGYSPATGIESLVVAPVSRASANQRAGRAGRMQSGKAYRLYTEEAYQSDLPEMNIPEMQRSNLAGVILQMKALGIDNVLRFPFLSPPPAKSMVRGLELLHALGAIDKDSKLTEPLGIQIAEFPLDPMMAKMLLSSGTFQCSHEIVTIAAMLQVQHVFISPPNKRGAANRAKLHFSCLEGDHMTLLNVYLAFVAKNKSAQWCSQHFLNYKSLSRAEEIRTQLIRYLRRFSVPLISCDGDEDAILRCITAGYFANAARLGLDGKYRTLRDDQLLEVHPSSVLYVEKHPSYVVFNDVLLTSAKYMRDIAAIDPAWLAELAPHFYEFNAPIKQPDAEIAVHPKKRFRP
jgi:ATP-dependent RNA helicase DDX35